MRIGIVGTIWINTPPPHYGGTEDVVYHLANGLVEKGHEVTLFAPQTAHTKARLSPTVTLPLREKDIAWHDISYHLYHISQAFEQKEQFDILHVHLNKNQDYMALAFAASSPTPVLTTIHFALPSPETLADRYLLLLKYKELPYTSISFSQQKGMPLHFLNTVYNGLDVNQFPFSDTPKDYVMWLGKIVPHKGTKEAILAAKKAHIPIVVAGVVDEGIPKSKRYFENEVKPLLDEHTRFVGPVGHEEKAQLLGGARALLNPIQWDEPFGLVMAEAQATGTPVIAFGNGAAPEVIQDKKTGFLVSSVDEMAAKISELNTIKRQDCRSFIAETFSVEHMVTGYETAYQTTITNWHDYQTIQHTALIGYKDKPALV